ncbi:hypothetical protein EDB83DRAFT_2311455 [Lactarius deliciosus]|nr:hypothetical protein EDB83DRAFT_2311455 [Lactarius deliciosus]
MCMPQQCCKSETKKESKRHTQGSWPLAAAATPDGNNAAHPILEAPGSMDLGHEGDRGGHNGDTAQVLRSAEEREVTTEQSTKRPRTPHFPGKSERTLSREKLAWRKLAAQGFTTLPDFFRKRTEKEDRQARLDALVAAAVTRHRSMQQREEEEEEEEAVTVPCVSKLISEPIQVDDSDTDVQPMPSPLKRTPLPVEESEESSSCKTLSDDDSDSECHCAQA